MANIEIMKTYLYNIFRIIIDCKHFILQKILQNDIFYNSIE